MTIPLTKGFVAIVDACDAWVANHKWCALVTSSGLVYAVRTGPGPERSYIYLHRLLMGAKPGQYVDHANQDGLDNRRRNLRICSNAENQWNKGPPRTNRSGFKGVSWCKVKRKWRSTIQVNERHIFLGYFSTREEAHALYVKAARQYHGQFARAA